MPPRAPPILIQPVCFPETKPGIPETAQIASSLPPARNKLLGMQRASESAITASSFAGLLASLAAPPPPAGPEWNDDQLADDVATFSYEQALKTHGRYQVPSLDQGPPAPGSESVPSRPERGTSASPDRSLKRASITIRLSEPECAQIHRRAAEAGLTVSAYLRSCTLEVESLRTQVKEALAQLREPAPVPALPPPARPRPWFRFWSSGPRMRIGGKPS
jgi:hypothetical protein